MAQVRLDQRCAGALGLSHHAAAPGVVSEPSLRCGWLLLRISRELGVSLRLPEGSDEFLHTPLITAAVPDLATIVAQIALRPSDGRLVGEHRAVV